MRASIRLGKVLSIPIEVNASWVLIFLLLTYVLAQEFESARLGWPVAQRWFVAIVMAVLFFLSVLFHELSHSVVAKRKGIPVQSITLFIFGGVSRLGREPDRPMTEFSVAVVGPLSSIVLSAVFGGLWYLLGGADSVLEVVLFLLAWTNLWLGVFNILPGYPLDGGRILRAAVWGLTGSYRRATRVATRSGQAIGALTVILGVALGIFVGAVNGIWVIIIGGFLFTIATASYREERSREALRRWGSDGLHE
ncbi:MAG: site-2 protease family protein [Dehalococcoidia bacterium]|nr:site-2 protease family protein [Dehalococcoidia bacterium]